MADWVIDASAAFLLLLPNSRAASLEQRLFLQLGDLDVLLAPSIIVTEVAAAITKSVRQGKITGTAAKEAFANWRDLIGAEMILLTAANTLVDDAFALSLRLHHPLHDCLYAALALQRNAAIITCDDSFARKAVSLGLQAELIGAE